MNKLQNLIKDSGNKRELKESLGKEIENIPGSSELKEKYKKQLFREIVKDENYPKLVDAEKKEKERQLAKEFTSLLIEKKSFDEAVSFREKNSWILNKRSLYLSDKWWNKDVFDYMHANWYYQKFTHDDLLSIKKVFNLSDQDFQVWIEKICCNVFLHPVMFGFGHNAGLKLAKEFDFLKTSPGVISALKESIIRYINNWNMLSDDEIKQWNDIMDFDVFLKSKEVQDVVKKQLMSSISFHLNYGRYDLEKLSSVFWLEKSFLMTPEIQEAYKKWILSRLESCLYADSIYSFLKDSGLGENFLKTSEAIAAINKWKENYDKSYNRLHNWDDSDRRYADNMYKSVWVLTKMLN